MGCILCPNVFSSCLKCLKFVCTWCLNIRDDRSFSLISIYRIRDPGEGRALPDSHVSSIVPIRPFAPHTETREGRPQTSLHAPAPLANGRDVDTRQARRPLWWMPANFARKVVYNLALCCCLHVDPLYGLSAKDIPAAHNSLGLPPFPFL